MYFENSKYWKYCETIFHEISEKENLPFLGCTNALFMCYEIFLPNFDNFFQRLKKNFFLYFLDSNLKELSPKKQAGSSKHKQFFKNLLSNAQSQTKNKQKFEKLNAYMKFSCKTKKKIPKTKKLTFYIII